MTINPKKNLDLLEKCQKSALKSSRKACIWRAWVDQTFNGQYTNWHEQSQNGPEHVTNAWRVWSLTFITPVTTDKYCYVGNTAQHCRQACFQDSDFAGDFEDSNQLLEESYVYSEVEHLSPSVGCARNKRQYPTVPQNRKLFSLGCWLRMDGIPALDFLGRGNWDVTFNKQHTARQGRLAQGNLCGTGDHSSKKTRTKTPTEMRKARGWAIVKRGVRTHQHTFFSRRVSVVHLWRQRSSDQDANLRTKSDDETYFQNPQSCSWLVVWQNQLGPPNLNQICWHRTSTCRHSDRRKFLEKWMESPLVIAQLEGTFRPFLSVRRAHYDCCRVETRTEHDLGRWLTDSKSKTCESGDAQPYKEETSSSSLGCRVNPDMTMKEKESAKHQETGCSVIQNRKSKIRKWVDKRRFLKPPGNWSRWIKPK